MVPLRPGEALVETRWGPMVCFTNDTGVSEALRRFGEYGAYEIDLYHRLLGDGGTFLDVGANIGILSVAMASLDERRRVVAFEPQLGYFGAAMANLRRFPNASVYPLALADREELLEVAEIQPDRIANYGALDLSKARHADRQHPAAATTIDDFLRRQGLVPDLIKIDVEGMEARVLAGGSETLRTALPIVSVEADRRDAGARAVDILIASGYRVYLTLFRVISAANPNYDSSSVHCRNLHVHLIGFGGAIPDWWQAGFQGSEIRGGSEYLAHFDRKFS